MKLLKAKIKIPANCNYYPAIAYQYQNQTVELEKIVWAAPSLPPDMAGFKGFKPYVILKNKLGYQFWGDWFFVEHVELLVQRHDCNCDLTLLMNRGCRCGGQ